MIHQPSGGAQGQASDIIIQAEEIMRIKKNMNKILSNHTGVNIAKIEKATDRDNFMSADEAKKLGIIDQVIVNRDDQISLNPVKEG